MNSKGFLCCFLTLFIGGISLFLVGFFQISYQKFEHSEFSERQDDSVKTIDGVSITPPAKQYSQTVLMLVDALRFDFVSKSSMPFSYNKTCELLKLRVDVPTVTLPRIKSLITGTLSNFIDVLLNLVYAEKLNDSLIHRLQSSEEIIVFAGDRVWSELFPTQFQRMDPTTDSFFVQDFYEGDKNVTKVLTRELQRTDWGLLILHYLGLDHIGHVEGSKSLKIIEKLKEMDAVVGQIFQPQPFNNKLVLLTGDHGMRTGGGHGGSSLEELYVPLLLLKENCTGKSHKIIDYSQIDLAATLAILLSVEIPKTSIGCLIPELLQDLSYEEQLYAFFYNANHLFQKATAKLGEGTTKHTRYLEWYKTAKQYHKEFLSAKRAEHIVSGVSFTMAKEEYIRLSREISGNLTENLVSFDYVLIAFGLSMTFVMTFYMCLFVLCKGLTKHVATEVTIQQLLLSLATAICLNTACYYTEFITFGSSFRCCFLSLPMSIIICTIAKSLQILKLLLASIFGIGLHFSYSFLWPPLVCFLFYTLSLSSSSFIEEEHQTWYYLCASNIILLFVTTSYRNMCRKCQPPVHNILIKIQQETWQNRRSILIFSIVPLLRKLNQTGDKWRHLEDFGDMLNETENRCWLSLTFLLGLMLLLLYLRKINKRFQFAGCCLAAFFVYSFRGMTGSVYFLPAKFNMGVALILDCFWLSVGAISIIGLKLALSRRKCLILSQKVNYIKLFETTITCLLLIASLLHKPHNVILLPAMLFTLDEAFRLCDKCGFSLHHSNVVVLKTMMVMFVSKTFYFYQGNSNSLATIDLNPGYIGQTTYNPVIVTIFVMLNTYSAQFASFLCLVINILSSNRNSLPLCQENQESPEKPLQQHLLEDVQFASFVYTALTTLIVTAYLCILITFRYHLFIYTVFAPKVFYEGFSVIILFLNVSYLFLCVLK